MRADHHSANPDAMNRSEAQRRYQNMITYQLRPMLADRSASEETKISIIKRLIRQATLIRANSGAVAGGGTREEVVDLLSPVFKPDSDASIEYKDWIIRFFRALGASYEGPGAQSEL